MAWSVLPVELLEKILDYLKPKDLLSSTLVCRHWNHAASFIVYRKNQLIIDEDMIDFLTDLAKIRWNFYSITVMCQDWDKIQPILNVLVPKFCPKNVTFVLTSIQHFDRLYETCLPWFEHAIEIGINIHNGKFDKPTNYTPNARIVNMPNARIVYISNQDDASIQLMPNCTKATEIEYRLHTQTFVEAFETNLPCLTNLRLIYYSNIENIEFVRNFPNLKFLSISIVVRNVLTENLPSNFSDAVCSCQRLEVLKFAIDTDIRDNPTSSFNLGQIAHSLVYLRCLKLNGLFVKSNETAIRFSSLKLLKLTDVKFCNKNTIVQLMCPKLETVEVAAHDCARIHTPDGCSIDLLAVDLGTQPLSDAFDTHIAPFFQRDCTIKGLKLKRSTPGELHLDTLQPSVLLELDSLILDGLHLSLNFFRQIAKWKEIQLLDIIGCCIDRGWHDGSIEMLNIRTLKVFNLDANNSYLPYSMHPWESVHQIFRLPQTEIIFT